ncbi:MAG: hypothetical protein JW836_15045 [Deltaproteobacteria bacterium]|nr:hypothetical protein [Deltaproteobacteria bacterium]
MFWCDKDFMEEEWSLSAKLFAGLVFNPFSSVNDASDPLFNWFCNRVIGTELPSLHGWKAKPEYVGGLGRNDWRLQVGTYQIAVECKFGDGIDPYGDCLKYLQGIDPSYGRVVIVASVSEFSELTTVCMDETDQVLRLKEHLRGKTVTFLGWHEIVEAALRRLPTEDAKEIMKNWAYKVNRRSLLLMPKDPITGDQAAALILQSKIANIPITHRLDARGDRRSTATIEEVCNKRNAPDWVWNFMASAQRACSKGNLVFESKRAGWVFGWDRVRWEATSDPICLRQPNRNNL